MYFISGIPPLKKSKICKKIIAILKVCVKHQVIEKFWTRCNGYNNAKKAWLGKQTASQIILFLRQCHVPRDETDVSVGLSQKSLLRRIGGYL